MKTGIMVPLGGFIILVSTSVFSLPRLAAEHATPCQTCHINPTGGGMRNEFGQHSVAFNELCLPQTKKFFVQHPHSPRLSESVTFGFDTRYLVFDNGRIFRMQTDFYLTAEPLNNIFYHFRFWENGVAEHYALVTLHDQRYYLKVGRFYPAYGLRNADHKAYIRERTGHGSNVYLDGLAMGAQLYGVNVTAEIFNPQQQGVYGLHLFHTRYLKPFGCLIGGSLRYTEVRSGKTQPFPHTKAVFGGVSYDRFTVLGEMDITGRSNDTLITYFSLTTRLEYGLYVIGEYNFFDGDRAVAGGVDEYLRFSVELFPIPFVELRPSYTVYTEGALQGQKDFFVQLHVGY